MLNEIKKVSSEGSNIVNFSESKEYTIIHSSELKTKQIYEIPDNTKVILIEEYNMHAQSAPMQTIVNLGINTFLHHVIISDIKENNSESYREYNLSDEAELLTSVIGINSGKTFEQNNANLNGHNAKANMQLVTIAKTNSDSEYRTDINNFVRETNGFILQRGVVMGEGRNIFSGVGFIKKGAAKSVNEQESRVLLLDGAKRGDANPLLLIDEYDVIAGHAASVGRVNEDDLYYMMSRGIPKVEAEKLITIGFLKPVIDQIKNKDIAELVLKRAVGVLYD